jgi:NAD-dependent dihydropyrimidine dehydrogenase PreA subunit
MIRKIIKIDENKCNGCKLCVNACHEGAIQMVNGRARLISDKYCDGLGDCLPGCPTGAIEIIEREADDYSEDAVVELKNEKKNDNNDKEKASLPCGCLGTMARKLDRTNSNYNENNKNENIKDEKKDEKEEPEKIKLNNKVPSELNQWPIQLKLVNPDADYFKDANLLIAADCTAFAYGNFHQEFIKDHITVIGCPKLDDVDFYIDKVSEILKRGSIKSLNVVRMEVPCCMGIVNIVKQAMLKSQVIVPYNEVVIKINGERKQ